MKTVRLAVVGAGILLAGLPQVASATPLRMDFSVTPMAGIYHYDITLSVDNHDGTFANGQGWGWLIFGDQASGPTNLTNFVMDAAVWPVGPWTSLSSSSGSHNGPTFLPLNSGAPNYTGVAWMPAGVGSSIHWAGTSTANLGDGELLFSTIAYNVGGAVPANFEPGHLTAAPEPASMAALGLGALAIIRRRRNKTA